MIPFYRLSGGGNDFLALAEPAELPAPRQIAAWCQRGRSLGADGLFLLHRVPPRAGSPPERAGPEERPRVRMTYFNGDGSPAELCLNGARCAARLAFELGWARTILEIATGAGTVLAERAEQGTVCIRLELPDPRPRRREVTLPREHVIGWLLDVGVPHFVVPCERSLAQVEVVEQGRALREHEAFAPAGANVDFVRFVNPHRLEIRTYERGVESETLACGTGILAATWLGLDRGRLTLPVEVATLGNLPVRVEKPDHETKTHGHRTRRPPSSWSLIGDARLIARGEIHPEAERVAKSPEWSR